MFVAPSKSPKRHISASYVGDQDLVDAVVVEVDGTNRVSLESTRPTRKAVCGARKQLSENASGFKIDERERPHNRGAKIGGSPENDDETTRLSTTDVRERASEGCRRIDMGNRPEDSSVIVDCFDARTGHRMASRC